MIVAVIRLNLSPRNWNNRTSNEQPATNLPYKQSDMSNNEKPNEVGYDFTNPTYVRMRSMTQAEIDAELKANRDSIKANNAKRRVIDKQLKEIQAKQKLADAALREANARRKRKAPRKKKSELHKTLAELVGLAHDILKILPRK